MELANNFKGENADKLSIVLGRMSCIFLDAPSWYMSESDTGREHDFPNH